MAQLTDDCFAFSGALLPVAEMERMIAQRVSAVAETESVALRAALGRVVAHDLHATLDLPPFDNSAVDGYAVRHADLASAGDTTLRVVARAAAGHGVATPLAAGEAARIFTGAPMPGGADTVFMQEDVRREGDAVALPAGLAVGANRRRAGEDIAAGAIMLLQGRRLSAADIALAAAQGCVSFPVRRRIRVAVFSTGDEVREPGNERPGDAIYDANRYLLFALLEKLGAQATDLGILRDDPVALDAAIRAAAADHDLVMTTGGVSTGEADHVRGAIERVGRLTFWRVAIKPGRPVAMGVIRGGAAAGGQSNNHDAVFVGLPGNPAAVFVTFVKVVRPLLLRLAGAEAETPFASPVAAAFEYRKRASRREYVRVALRRNAAGAVEAVKHAQDGAGVITSLTQTDGLVELAEDVTRVAPGDIVPFLSYAALTG